MRKTGISNDSRKIRFLDNNGGSLAGCFVSCADPPQKEKITAAKDHYTGGQGYIGDLTGLCACGLIH